MYGSRAGGFKIKLIICSAAPGRICLTNMWHCLHCSVTPEETKKNVSCMMLLCGYFSCHSTFKLTLKFNLLLA